MEYGLGRSHWSFTAPRRKSVLILVVMEYGLGREEKTMYELLKKTS